MAVWQRPDNLRTPSTVLVLIRALALLFKSLYLGFEVWGLTC